MACLVSAVHFTAVQNFDVVTLIAKEMVKADTDSEYRELFHSLLSTQLEFIPYKIFLFILQIAKSMPSNLE